MLLNILKKDLTEYDFNSKNPLLITNPSPIQDNSGENPYGLLIKLGKNTEIKNDPRFASGNNKININGLERNLWTKDNGAAGLCSYSNVVDSFDGNLRYSGGGGRVVLIDAEGVQNSENLERKYLEKLEQEKQEKIKEIEKRYTKAVNFLNGKE